MVSGLQHSAFFLRGIKVGILLAMLVVYAASSVRFDLLHRYFHPEELSQLHSVEHEQDPCHVTIFHQVAKDCGHDSHVTEDLKCQLCDLCVVPYHSLATLANITKVITAQTFFSFSTSNKDIIGLFQRSDRGPPSLSA